MVRSAAVSFEHPFLVLQEDPDAQNKPQCDRFDVFRIPDCCPGQIGSRDVAMTDQSAPQDEAPYEKQELQRARSLVLVNTGHGKGKSTAAFGTIMRAVARGWKVAVVQSLKSGKWNTGEEEVSRGLGVDWFAAGDGFTWDSNDLEETQAKAVAAWDFSKGLIAAGNHHLIVLDEISYSMTWDWIDPADVAASVASRPSHVNVILTGRDMAAEVIEVADTVTEMVKIKHPFDRKIRAKKGIDY